MFVCCECSGLSGRGLCDELITRPEESHPMWCDVVCDLETSRMRRPWPALGRSATETSRMRRPWPALGRSATEKKSYNHGTENTANLEIWQAVHRSIIIPLLIPTWYTIFYINYIKLSSSTCFERHPLIFRRSMILTLRSLTLYIYGAPILDVSRSHTTTQHSR